MASQHFIDALVPCRIAGLAYIRTGGQQGFDDRKVVNARLVYGGPGCATQNRSAVHVLLLERSLPFDEQLDRIQVSAVCRPVQRRQPGSGPRRRIDSLSEQELGHAGSTQKTRARERFDKRLRLVVKQPILVPLDYATFGAVKRRMFVEQRFETRKVTPLKPS